MADTVLQQRIKELADHHGSIRAAARVLMVDHTYLYRLSAGDKDNLGDDLLRKLKLRRVVTYERINSTAASGVKAPLPPAKVQAYADTNGLPPDGVPVCPDCGVEMEPGEPFFHFKDCPRGVNPSDGAQRHE